MKKLTLKRLMEIKRMLDETERERPKTYIDGEEYILFPKPEKLLVELDKE